MNKYYLLMLTLLALPACAMDDQGDQIIKSTEDTSSQEQVCIPELDHTISFSLREACRKGLIDEVKDHLKAGGHDQKSLVTALWYAAENGHPACVKAILDSSLELQALFKAAKEQYDDIIRPLKDIAPHNIVGPHTNDTGEIASQLAVKKAILGACAINLWDKEKEKTPLFMAVKNEGHGDRALPPHEAYMRTLVHAAHPTYAAEQETDPYRRILLEEYRAALNLVEVDGTTMHRIGFRKRHPVVVEDSTPMPVENVTIENCHASRNGVDDYRE